MKKAVVIRPIMSKENEAVDLSVVEIKKYDDFALEKGLTIEAMMEYPSVLLIRHGDAVLSAIKTITGQDTFIVNDECWLMSNAYLDGRFLKCAEEEGITIWHRDEGKNVQEIWDNMSIKQRKCMKDAVMYALEKLERNCVMSIHNSEQAKECHDYITECQKEDGFKRVVDIALNEYDPIVDRFLTEIIKKQAISKIYLFGDLNENNEFVKEIRGIAEKSHCEFDTINKEPDYIERLNMTLSHYN